MDALLLMVVRNQKQGLMATLTTLQTVSESVPFEILIIDDASDDGTYETARAFVSAQAGSSVQIIRNLRRQGYGGNLKVGFRYALDRGMIIVATVPPDAGRSVLCIRTLLETLRQAPPKTGAVLGFPLSRGIDFVLTPIQNLLAGTHLKGWHTPYRAYRVDALEEIGFELNTPKAHFDIEILLQLLNAGRPPLEIPIDARGSRLSGSGLPYVRDMLKASLKFRLQKYNLFYDVRYHPEVLHAETVKRHETGYHEKLHSRSPHSLVCEDNDLVPKNSRVLDLGCSTGYVARLLTAKKNCQVVGVDVLPPEEVEHDRFTYHRLDLERDGERLNGILEEGNFDVILMLDVLEHLAAPEVFLLNLYRRNYSKTPKFIFSTGNVAFFVIRLMLLCGYFNYGYKGILDVTHKRLFSWRTFKNLLDQTGFLISERHGLPLPYRELGFPPLVCRLLEFINTVLIGIRPSLFAYQILCVTTPLVSPEQVLRESRLLESSPERKNR
jgi:glycosyltransferase involved in cell wall biosynthesis